MPTNNNTLTFSASPHIKSNHSTRKIMIMVCLALLPSAVVGCVYFGLNAVLMLALSVASAVLAEWVYLLIMKKPFKEILKQFDFSSCVTGLLIGMCIGVNYPLYAPVFGSIFAIIVVKMLFGGTGKNLVNPAIAGRIFIFISFQTVITKWVTPFSLSPVTGATALESFLSGGGVTLSNLDLLLGNNLAGCIGEVCKLALIAGGLFLMLTGIVNFRWPIIYIGVTGLFTVCLNGFDFNCFLPSILSGGLMLGAIFMSTDYVTTPNTKLGNYIYFIALGLLTAGLRQATHMETVSFAILLMNLVVPLIDKLIVPKPFGYIKPTKQKEAK